MSIRNIGVRHHVSYSAYNYRERGKAGTNCTSTSPKTSYKILIIWMLLCDHMWNWKIPLTIKTSSVIPGSFLCRCFHTTVLLRANIKRRLTRYFLHQSSIWGSTIFEPISVNMHLKQIELHDVDLKMPGSIGKLLGAVIFRRTLMTLVYFDNRSTKTILNSSSYTGFRRSQVSPPDIDISILFVFHSSMPLPLKVNFNQTGRS